MLPKINNHDLPQGLYNMYSTQHPLSFNVGTGKKTHKTKTLLTGKKKWKKFQEENRTEVHGTLKKSQYINYDEDVSDTRRL